ncbi:transcriptional regulator, TetR family [Desulfatibacillum alkenivorans DSM 16219]|jgi:AcrR family transcriptional regulator|uniref:Transcriptional regulator, TetR family n=1 Tax=Desulfatibacillum alkenivorans DSM 16219 TaxID=1121393 RepID=A0A1M6L272_9BACT|nr:TetR/AcrR family transcriptional regulator [Desulfatibacillum alkenivorans]SHJ65263.1 transcriptional regulator, TetR family [Desulfatibacillum alkenivorans DSM 16219]
MGRIPRIEYKDALYYVHARSAVDLAAPDQTPQNLLDLLARTADRFSLQIFAYAIMPREYHVLIKTEQPNLSRAFQWFSTAFARKCNELRRRKGAVFKGRYKASLIENPKTLLDLSHYIHNLPRALTGTDPAAYQWSSFRAYAGMAPHPGYLTPSPIMDLLENKPYTADFNRFTQKGENPLNRRLHGAFLGSPSWARNLLDQTGGAKDSRCPLPGTGANGDAVQQQINQAIALVCAHGGISRAALLSRTRKRNFAKDLRDALIAFLFQGGRFTSQEIAGAFGVTDSAVSHLMKAFESRRAGRDPSLQEARTAVEEALALHENGGEAPVSDDVMPSIKRRIHDLSFIHDARGLNRSRGQEDKSQKTRRQLILSTLYCLHEHGYHGATLSRILDHAGVSRGAWRHHFKNKTALVAAAARAMYEGTARLARANAPRLAKEPDPLHAMFDFIWATFHQGWHRNVWLEFTVAARTDAQLRALIEPVTRDFFNTVGELTAETLESAGPDSIPPDLLMDLSLYLSRGMAIQSIVSGDEAHYQRLRNAWSRVLGPYFRFRRTP